MPPKTNLPQNVIQNTEDNSRHHIIFYSKKRRWDKQTWGIRKKERGIPDYKKSTKCYSESISKQVKEKKNTKNIAADIRGKEG